MINLRGSADVSYNIWEMRGIIEIEMERISFHPTIV
jgi:hypothetical protein